MLLICEVLIPPEPDDLTHWFYDQTGFFLLLCFLPYPKRSLQESCCTNTQSNTDDHLCVFSHLRCAEKPFIFWKHTEKAETMTTNSGQMNINFRKIYKQSAQMCKNHFEPDWLNMKNKINHFKNLGSSHRDKLDWEGNSTRVGSIGQSSSGLNGPKLNSEKKQIMSTGKFHWPHLEHFSFNLLQVVISII